MEEDSARDAYALRDVRKVLAQAKAGEERHNLCSCRTHSFYVDTRYPVAHIERRADTVAACGSTLLDVLPGHPTKHARK